MKYKIDIKHMCSVANISRSGYYSYVKRLSVPSTKMLQDETDFELIMKAYKFKNRNKGARQIKMALLHQYDVVMNLKKIRRLMKKFGLFCLIRKANPYRRMAKAMKTNNTYKNVVDRKFDIGIPGKIALTDITYINYGVNKRAYLSTVIDGCTREILAHRLSKTLEVEFVIETLDDLVRNNTLSEGAIIHSDQGCHYTSIVFQNRVKVYNLIQSMSRRGNCWEGLPREAGYNAPQESFFGHMKDELNITKDKLTFEDLQAEIDDYMVYYNNDRYQWGLNRLSPVMYKNNVLNGSLILKSQ